MIPGNIKMALDAVRNAKWRSLLTMLGIIIGVVSVVTTVSLGEGIKQEVVSHINHVGKDLITVRAGRRAEQGAGLVFSQDLASSSLSEADVATIRQAAGVKQVVPIGMSSGIAQIERRSMNDGSIIATNEHLPSVVNQKVEFGAFFTASESNRHLAIIGKRVAERLFQENVPIGRTFQIRGHDFIVRGVFEEFASDPLAPGRDYNKAVFIPFQAAKSLNGAAVPIAEIQVKTDTSRPVTETAQNIRRVLQRAHAGQEDFTVLRQDENLQAASELVTMITQMIAGIAAISLLVGGIGIMNIMLVSVTERTREIGIRKAIGATNRQIMGQFLVEAAVLSLVGGLAGILISIAVNLALRVLTDLQPVVTLPVMLVAVGTSWLVGIIFGVTPAVRAAHKDPIEALRYE